MPDTPESAQQSHAHDTPPRACDHTSPGKYTLVPFSPGQLLIRYSAYLPHWEQEGATYSVTFRLADSLPQALLRRWLGERRKLTEKAEADGRPLTAFEKQRLRELHSERVESYLDAGHGACHLRDDRAAVAVRDAVLHFDGSRCDILAWCVMPNHAHVIVRPRPGHDLPRIVNSWKSYSANQVNRILGRTGTLWQPDSFDHLIRDGSDLERSVAYVIDNPRAAGLVNWAWVGYGSVFQK